MFTVITGILWAIWGYDPLTHVVSVNADYGGLSGWGLAFFIVIALDLAAAQAT